MHYRGKAQLALLGAASVFVLAACGPSADSRKPNAIEPSLGALAPVTPVTSVSLPMDAYGLTAEQKILDTQASDLMIRDCMRKAGATWQGSGQKTTAMLNSVRQAERATRFGLVDEAVADQYGYHGAPQPNIEKEPSQTSAAYVACAKETKLKMGEGAPPAADFTLSFQLPDEAVARTANDSRYADMTKRWASCMAGKGYMFQSPDDAAKDSLWPTEKATAAEIQTANADVKCKQEVNYLSLVVALRTAYEKQLIEEHTEVVHRLKAYYDKRVKLVVDLIAANN